MGGFFWEKDINSRETTSVICDGLILTACIYSFDVNSYLIWTQDYEFSCASNPVLIGHKNC